MELKKNLQMANQPIIVEVEYPGLPKSTMIQFSPMKSNFILMIKKDKRTMKNINVYYELMTRENCNLRGLPYDMKTLNCIDGDTMFLSQKKLRESRGYTYGTPTTVIVEGIKMERIIIEGPGKGVKNYGDFFGMVSNYIQASHEIVCYMVKF